LILLVDLSFGLFKRSIASVVVIPFIKCVCPLPLSTGVGGGVGDGLLFPVV
jgi:hypothetical protein